MRSWSKRRLRIRGQLQRIGKRLAYAELAFGCRRKRLAGTTPVPVHHDEVFFHLALKIMREEHRGHTRAAVKKQKDGLARVMTADQYPLRYPAQLDGFKNSDAVVAGDGRRTAAGHDKLDVNVDEAREYQAGEAEQDISGKLHQPAPNNFLLIARPTIRSLFFVSKRFRLVCTVPIVNCVFLL